MQRDFKSKIKLKEHFNTKYEVLILNFYLLKPFWKTWPSWKKNSFEKVSSFKQDRPWISINLSETDPDCLLMTGGRPWISTDDRTRDASSLWVSCMHVCYIQVLLQHFWVFFRWGGSQIKYKTVKLMHNTQIGYIIFLCADS